MQHSPWPSLRPLSSAMAGAERFLAAAGFDRAPWAAVALAAGIAAWFTLPDAWSWTALIAGASGVTAGAAAVIPGRYPYVRQAAMVLALLIAVGCGLVWVKSALVGRAAIAGPVVADFTGTVLSVQDQPGEDRRRVLLATRDPADGRAIKVRINLPRNHDQTELAEGDRIRIKARLMPPSPPMLPGGYDFARTAWFQGLSATGSALGPPVVEVRARPSVSLETVQASLSAHVRGQLPGSAGAIAATLASGDRGAMDPADEQAMRDSGLAHLLSVSGLHVSAVVAAAYFVVMRLLAAFPWLALRVRLPLVAASAGALAAIAYTLVTGAEVPTVRSCIAALLVLAALAMGRQPLSLRMVAVAAFFVMVFWPESVVGPSFQMSFAAVITIVALHDAAPFRAFLAPRDEGLAIRAGRYLAMLLATGLAIELALMPIAIWHFHRAGIYGALANMVAIPLTTLVTMPLIALGLLLDLVGAGAPAWWLAGLSIDLLLWIARTISIQPGAVTALPAAGMSGIMLCVAGGLWLALWRGRIRFWGAVSAVIGLLVMATARPPDLLVPGDGRQVAITRDGMMLVLRESRSDFVRDNLSEIAGFRGKPLAIPALPGARCNGDFCAFGLERGGRRWRLLLSRGRDAVAERDLAAACANSDVVVSDRWLPRSCRPLWLKADRRLLGQTGGLTIDLASGHITTVAESQGRHGWWRAGGAERVPRPAESALADKSGVAGQGPAEAGR